MAGVHQFIMYEYMYICICIFKTNIIYIYNIVFFSEETSSTDTDKVDPKQSEGMLATTKKSKAHSNWGKIFRPWKWKRKKRSENFKKTAISESGI